MKHYTVLILLFSLMISWLSKAQIEGQCGIGEKSSEAGKCYPAVAGQVSPICYAKVAGHDGELKGISVPAASTDQSQSAVPHEHNTMCDPDDNASLAMYDQGGNLKAGWMWVWPNPNEAFGQKLRMVTPPGTFGMITIKNLLVGGDMLIRNSNPNVSKTQACPSGYCMCQQVCIPTAPLATATDTSKPQPNVRTLIFTGDHMLETYLKTPANSCSDVGTRVNNVVCPCPEGTTSARGADEVCPVISTGPGPFPPTKQNAPDHIQVLYAKVGFPLSELTTVRYPGVDQVYSWIGF